MHRRSFLTASSATFVAAALPQARAAGVMELPLYYPVAVGGPIAKILDGYATAFHKANPDIVVRPVYTGNYIDTIAKTLTALKSGGEGAPKMAVLLAVDIFSLLDQNVLVAMDDLDRNDSTWLKSFYPAFMTNSIVNGKMWSVPFQRSTPVMFWNKEAFKAVGMEPDKAPETWDAMSAAGAKLTKSINPQSPTTWGLNIPTSGSAHWLFQGLSIANGQPKLVSDDGATTYFDAPETVAALEYLVGLSRTQKIMAPGLLNWGTAPQDFFEKRCAMMWTTTGNLTDVKAHAKFDFGVGMLPKSKNFGAPTGGGNLYVFSNATPAERMAALKFIRFVTEPQLAANWGIQTGYVATSPAAWETEAMKSYVKNFPQAIVARDQLKYAEPEICAHDNQRITKFMDDALAAAVTGQKSPKEALSAAQASASAVLARYRHG